MRTSPSTRPADYVRPRLPEARIGRMWSAVARAERRAPGRRVRRAAMLGALAAAACIALVVLARRWAPVAQSGRAVASGDTFVTQADERRVTLPDGSLLAIGHGTLLDVVRVADDQIRLRLTRGVLMCDVPRLEKRSFVVEAGGAEIAVKGTLFTVELEPETVAGPELSVSVERGRVEVRRDEQTVLATLEPGQKWSSVRPAPPEPSAEPATSAAGPAAAPLLGARELMERANLARVAGRPADAARDYGRLCERFAGDARAGLAGFELGRIRLHSLGDPRGALEAFRFALAHRSGGFFAEDAEAGIVEALDRMGDAQACAQARDAFLAHHGQSAHVRRLRLLCSSR